MFDLYTTFTKNLSTYKKKFNIKMFLKPFNETFSATENNNNNINQN